MPLFNKDRQADRQEARQLRRKLRVDGKQEKTALKLANRGTLFGQVGGIVDSITGSSQNSSVTADNRNLAVATNADGSTDIMTTIKNFAPIIGLVAVGVYLMKSKKGRKRR
jgi:hypothetical protein